LITFIPLYATLGLTVNNAGLTGLGNN